MTPIDWMRAAAVDPHADTREVIADYVLKSIRGPSLVGPARPLSVARVVGGWSVAASANHRGRAQRPSATFSYDTSNRLTSDGSSTFTWSSADRLTGRGSDMFGYDALDRLTSSTVSGTSRTYSYNGDGLLQSRTQGGSTTNLLWDPAASPSRLLQVGSDKIVYGLGPLYIVSGSATTTFARDGGKSVRAELSGSGAVNASFRYKAYGAIAQSNGALAPTYLGYAGQLLDPTGLYYLRARWYEPTTGRFLSRDPEIGEANAPDTLNAFGYGAANPILLLDPSGLRPLSDPCIDWETPCPGDVDIEIFIPTKCQLFPLLNSCRSRGTTTVVVKDDDTASAGRGKTTAVPILGPNGVVFARAPYPPDITVGEILRGKQGKIRYAELPAGSPSWDDISGVTWREVERKAQGSGDWVPDNKEASPRR